MATLARDWKLTLAYDGTGFSGWQVQPGRRTVQGRLERALQVIEGQQVRVAGSGRTDAGVHALGQVASCELSCPIPAAGLLKALNRLLPPAIRVLSAETAPAGFHARHHATGKTYEYRILRASLCPPFVARYVLWHPYPLDVDAMIAAAPLLEGTKDFRSFASNSGEPLADTVRTVFSSSLRLDGEMLAYRVRGSGFLYHMVRNLVGTLLEVGRGNLVPEDLERILGDRDRAAAGPAVPARGLFLESVDYAGTDGRLETEGVDSRLFT